MGEKVSGQIEAVLADAERSLLEIVGSAAGDADYVGIDLARSTAEAVGRLKASLGEPTAKHSRRGPPERRTADDEKTVRRKTRGRAQGKPEAPYPRFEVTDSGLVKIGWSKKRNAEYTQRIPQDSFLRIVAALENVADDALSPVPSDVILHTVGERGDDIPTHQTYGTLRFLRARQAVRQVSRGEYAVPKDIRERATRSWNEALSEK